MPSAPIYDQLWHQRYDHPNTIQRHSEGTPVNLLDDIRAEVTRAVTWTEDEFRAALPTVAKAADTADAIASSTAAKAVLDAVLTPADEAWIVGLVQRLDKSVHAAEATAGEGDTPADADVPGDPGEPQPAPPGFTAVGQA